jgi:hypothetical protein
MRKTLINVSQKSMGLLALLAVFILAGCPQTADDNGTDKVEKDTSSQWSPGAALFQLKGENAVTNVKLTWRKLARADRYLVYRDGAQIGTFTGDTMDDYALAPGATYTYTVKAYNGYFLEAESLPVVANPFVPTGALQSVKDNSVSGGVIDSAKPGEPDGFKFGDYYYRYGAGSSGSGVDRIVTIYEEKSSDGISFGAPRSVGTVEDAKLEGAGFHKVKNKVVLTAHHENGSDYSLGNFFLATITPDGNMVVTFKGHPFDHDSRDQAVFVDNDGSAYALSATRTNADIAIFKLNEDWTNFEGDGPVNIIFKDQHRETPFILHLGASYFFFSSRASGWYPSQAMYGVATSLDGEWSELRELGNATTFGSQFNHVRTYPGSGGGNYGLYGWRWGAQFHHSEGANYPRLALLAFSGDFITAEYFSEVAYYPEHGLIGVQPGRNLSLGASVTASSASETNSNFAYVTDGADLTGSGYFQGYGTFPYDIVVDLKKTAVVNEINLTTRMMNGSEGSFKYLVYGSADGISYTQLVDNSNNWKPGFKIDKITDTNAYRYIRLTVNSVKNVSNNDADIGTWADGIIELAIFGTPAP